MSLTINQEKQIRANRLRSGEKEKHYNPKMVEQLIELAKLIKQYRKLQNLPSAAPMRKEILGNIDWVLDTLILP